MHSTVQNHTAAGERHYIELIGKAVGVLEALARTPEGSNLKDLSARTGLGKSTVHRILHSLKRHGYVEQRAVGGPYRLGLQVIVLSRGVHVAKNLVDLARPYSRELMEMFDESTYVAVLREGRAIFLDVQESHRDLQLVGPLGAMVHFHATAAGKAIAAFSPPERASALMRTYKPRPLTGKTMVSPVDIEAEWVRVRRLGYALNDEETIHGAIFFASPILDSRENVCGSISIGMPKPRYSEALGKKVVTQLKDSCRRLSEALKVVGYVHDRPW